MTTDCSHCTHPWDRHTGRCMECGCMWTDPAKQPPPPPEPPSARDELIANIENTIWVELERQQEDLAMGPYVDREMGMVDSSGAGLDMTAVAATVATLFVDSQDDCTWCHDCTAIDGWKLPIEGDDDE
jgi:hypothetical protein